MLSAARRSLAASELSVSASSTWSVGFSASIVRNATAGVMPPRFTELAQRNDMRSIPNNVLPDCLVADVTTMYGNAPKWGQRCVDAAYRAATKAWSGLVKLTYCARYASVRARMDLDTWESPSEWWTCSPAT